MCKHPPTLIKRVSVLAVVCCYTGIPAWQTLQWYLTGTYLVYNIFQQSCRLLIPVQPELADGCGHHVQPALHTSTCHSQITSSASATLLRHMLEACQDYKRMIARLEHVQHKWCQCKSYRPTASGNYQADKQIKHTADKQMTWLSL